MKPADRVDRPTNQAVFDVTRKACGEAGWDYVVATGPEPAVWANLSWLAGYRRRTADPFAYEALLLDLCDHAMPFVELIASVGPDHGRPVREEPPTTTAPVHMEGEISASTCCRRPAAWAHFHLVPLAVLLLSHSVDPLSTREGASRWLRQLANGSLAFGDRRHDRRFVTY